MRNTLISLAFVAASAAACAAGYDDFVRANAAQQAGNLELALSSYNAALSAGDLSAAFIPNAYLGRAQIYYYNGKCALALADLDAALALRPALVGGLDLRAFANDCLGKTDAAEADLNALITTAPTINLYTTRGDFYWRHARFSQAAADYAKAAELHSKRGFEWRPAALNLLWYAISASRSQSFVVADFVAADFVVRAKGFDLDPWPGPLVSFYLGKSPPDAIYREAAGGDNPSQKKCEADFFIGEWQLAAGNPAGKTLLQTVPANCPKNSYVAVAARIDLHRIP